MGIKHTFIYFILFLIIIAPTFSDHHTEEDKPVSHSEFSPAFRITSITEYRKWDFHMSLSGEYRADSSDLYGFHTVLYYRFLKNVKAGLIYSLQKGERHNDDWITEGDGWYWKDSTQRYESLLGADLTPRFLLPFLPGKNWLLSTKTRYSYNLNNDQQKMLLQPGISYFHFKNRQPLWSANSAYAFYFALNFGDSPLYEHGPYLSLILHSRQNLLFSLTGHYSVRTWSSSESFETAGGEYQVNDQRYTLEASIIWKIDIPDKKR